MERDFAAAEFATVLLREGVEHGTTAFFNCMTRSMRRHGSQWEKLRQWQEEESEAGKELFRFAIREAMILAVFGLAAYLDGDSGGVPLDDRVGQFALALNVYRSADDSWEGVPEETVEICPTRRGEDVHDLFMNLVDEQEADREHQR